MAKAVKNITKDKATVKLSLKDFGVDRIKSTLPTGIVSIDFQDNEATRRLVMHSARRVISKHKDELQELAYK